VSVHVATEVKAAIADLKKTLEGINAGAIKAAPEKAAQEADMLQHALELAGVRVWRDTDDLWPDQGWRMKTRQAIVNDALLFLACFSNKSLSRQRAISVKSSI
jgi:hypothetical protein